MSRTVSDKTKAEPQRAVRSCASVYPLLRSKHHSLPDFICTFIAYFLGAPTGSASCRLARTCKRWRDQTRVMTPTSLTLNLGWMLRKRFFDDVVSSPIGGPYKRLTQFGMRVTVLVFVEDNDDTGELVEYRTTDEWSQLFACFTKLENLTMATTWNPVHFFVPDGVKAFKMSEQFDQPGFKLPDSIERFWMGDCFDQPGLKLPTALRVFFAGHSYDQPDLELPDSLEEFVMSDSHNTSSMIVLPKYLKRFTMGSQFNLPGLQLPDTLEYFKMGWKYNQSDLKLPPRLHQFIMGESFNQPSLVLPASIRVFKMGRNFQQPGFKLPRNIFKFEMGDEFRHSKTKFKLPKSLRVFKMGIRFAERFVADKHNVDLSNFLQMGDLLWHHRDYVAKRGLDHIPKAQKRIEQHIRKEFSRVRIKRVGHASILLENCF